MPRLATALTRLPSLLLLVFPLSPLLRCVTRRRPMRVARVLPELLGELGQPFFQLADAPVLLRDARRLRGDDHIFRRQLCLELRDPIVSPVALHELRNDRSAY